MESEMLLTTFEQKLITLKYANNTIKAYRDYARLFLKHIQNYPSLKDVPLSVVESFIHEKVEQEKISASYQKALVGAIKKMYDLILDKKIKLDYLYPKRTSAKLPKVFSKEEVKQILDHSKNLKHKALLMTIYSCGLRLNELLDLKIEDIRVADKMVQINQSRGSIGRMISLPDKLLSILQEYQQAYKPTQYLFEGGKGNRYTERSVQLVLKKALAKAKVSSDGTVHSLRHSYATHLIQSGVDIHILQELLGHQNIKTTMIYKQIIDKKKTLSPLDLL